MGVLVTVAAFLMGLLLDLQEISDLVDSLRVAFPDGGLFEDPLDSMILLRFFESGARILSMLKEDEANAPLIILYIVSLLFFISFFRIFPDDFVRPWSNFFANI